MDAFIERRWPLTNTFKRKVFPLFATDDYPFSIFPFPDETNTWKPQQECDACFHPIIPSTHSTYSPIRNLVSHTCEVFTFAHEMKRIHTLAILGRPSHNTKNFPMAHSSKNLQKCDEQLSRLHFQQLTSPRPPLRRRTPNPSNEAT